jgi:cbb3-type cytochrome oxidase maturation protein
VEVIFALLAISVVLVIGIAWVLLWAVHSGQFEDLEGPAWRVVMDDDGPAGRRADDAEPAPEDSRGDARTGRAEVTRPRGGGA